MISVTSIESDVDLAADSVAEVKSATAILSDIVDETVVDIEF